MGLRVVELLVKAAVVKMISYPHTNRCYFSIIRANLNIPKSLKGNTIE